MTRGKLTLALLLLLPVSAVAKEPDLTGHWSGTFRSRYFNTAPFTLGLRIKAAEVPPIPGLGGGHRMQGYLDSNSGPSYCIAGHVNLQIDREGSNVVIAGTNARGDTIAMVGTVDPTGSLMTLNYVTNGSVSGRCESDDGTADLKKQ